MSDGLSQGTDTSSSTSSAPAAAPAADTSSQQSSTSSASNAPAAGDTPKISAEKAAAEAAGQTWTPDWKYKFNGQEKEVDEFFRPLGKDQQSLQKLKDFIQRAEAVEMYKPQALKAKDLETKWSKAEPVMSAFEKLNDLYGKGEHERVLEQLGYTDEQLFKLVKQKLDRQAMDPQSRALHEEKRQYQLEKERLMQENEQYRSQASQEMARVTNYELDSELGKADYASVKDAYDRAYGSGAFKNLVIDRGAILVDRAGKHIPPSELIPMVAKEFAPFVGGQQQGIAAPAAPQSQPQLKVIPQVGKGTGSPAKTSINSIADLKKAAAAANRR
jgi:hypothetical protein